MRKIVIILILGIFTQVLIAQPRSTYRQIPNEFLEKYIFPREDFHSVRNNIFYDAIDITSYLPQKYSTEGNVDYTVFLQQAINNNIKVIMPNFPVLINSNGLKLRNNSKILFQENSRLIIKPNNKSRYHGVLIDNIEGVELYYAHIIGDKYEHHSTSGQWGMGIWIKHSNNIRIYNPVIKKCWGDGIYIGNERDIPSRMIYVYNAFLDDNRRNGISVTSGKNILIENALISNTNGQNPRSGIDIEPNSNEDVIENIVIESPITFNNAMHGIVISVGNLAGDLTKVVSVKVNNHIDYYSTIGLGLAVTRENLEYKNKLKGKIIINDPTYHSNSHSSVKTYRGKLHDVELSINMKGKPYFNSQMNDFLNKFKKGVESKIK